LTPGPGSLQLTPRRQGDQPVMEAGGKGRSTGRADSLRALTRVGEADRQAAGRGLGRAIKNDFHRRCLEVRSRRVGGGKYQDPSEGARSRPCGRTLALALGASRSRATREREDTCRKKAAGRNPGSLNQQGTPSSARGRPLPGWAQGQTKLSLTTAGNRGWRHRHRRKASQWAPGNRVRKPSEYWRTSDAGKNTKTERILYYTGNAPNKMG